MQGVLLVREEGACGPIAASPFPVRLSPPSSAIGSGTDRGLCLARHTATDWTWTVNPRPHPRLCQAGCRVSEKVGVAATNRIARGHGLVGDLRYVRGLSVITEMLAFSVVTSLQKIWQKYVSHQHKILKENKKRIILAHNTEYMHDHLFGNSFRSQNFEQHIFCH